MTLRLSTGGNYENSHHCWSAKPQQQTLCQLPHDELSLNHSFVEIGRHAYDRSTAEPTVKRAHLTFPPLSSAWQKKLASCSDVVFKRFPVS
jgi:hypothetical protein